ncbi:hypothetical protein GVN21_00120 [Caulobacter sp. SLTY]|uniref:hypothetical protein n=1 Tax=Caulobacter sp. SLTY TaxID=2683262 RepID=UPI0014125A81|nr:hypothetical protein [Caulobacter sp. SLTY]NBB13756.1 hypothetical protein [Caulobacter sp. SLTY]
MIGRSVLILALALIGAPALAAPAPAADPRLDAFRAACMPEHRSPEKRPAVFRREGWVPAADDESPMLAGVLKLSRAYIEESKADGVNGDLSVWRKEVGGRTAFLVMTTVSAKSVDVTGCYVYDFGALNGIDPALVTAWLGEAPAQTVDRAGIAAQIWNAEGIEGVVELQNGLVAPNSQAAKILGFHGVSIKVTSGVEAAKDPS